MQKAKVSDENCAQHLHTANIVYMPFPLSTFYFLLQLFVLELIGVRLNSLKENFKVILLKSNKNKVKCEIVEMNLFIVQKVKVNSLSAVVI